VQFGPFPGYGFHMSFGLYTNDAILYGGIGLILLGVLIVVKIIMRAVAEKNVRGVSRPTMTLDDLEHMTRTGLIDEDELRRAKRSVAEKMVEASLPRVSRPAEQSLELELAVIDSQTPAVAEPAEPSPPSPKPAAPEEPQPPSAAAEPPAAAPRPALTQSRGAVPLDVEGLRASGAIDEAEYQRLKAYFDRRGRES
jgi:hypothetical protein